MSCSFPWARGKHSTAYLLSIGSHLETSSLSPWTHVRSIQRVQAELKAEALITAHPGSKQTKGTGMFCYHGSGKPDCCKAKLCFFHLDTTRWAVNSLPHLKLICFQKLLFSNLLILTPCTGSSVQKGFFTRGYSTGTQPLNLKWPCSNMTHLR